MQLTPRQTEAVSLYPEESRARLIRMYESDNRMEAQKKEVLAGVMAAWGAAKRGEDHDRLIGGLDGRLAAYRRARTARNARNAAFMPRPRPTEEQIRAFHESTRWAMDSLDLNT